MARPLGAPDTPSDLRARLTFIKKRPRDPGQVIFDAPHESFDAPDPRHEPLEVKVVDTSIGTGGGSCGEGADKISPSTQGGGVSCTTASPR